MAFCTGCLFLLDGIVAAVVADDLQEGVLLGGGRGFGLEVTNLVDGNAVLFSLLLVSASLLEEAPLGRGVGLRMEVLVETERT